MIHKDVYFVAVKVFLRNEKGELLITKDCFGDWDIPGGRLREEDFSVSLENVVKRKMEEELGGDVIYTLYKPVLFMRHERNEVLPSGEREKRRIFAIGYDALYRKGSLDLGKNHTEYQWVSLQTFIPEEFFTGGWLQGIKEFQEIYKTIILPHGN